MMSVFSGLCVCVSLFGGLVSGWKPRQEFTFMLPAGRTECFYQTCMKDVSMQVEYQVIAGAGLDVGFTIISPGGYRIVSEFKSSDGIHIVDPTEDGDYRLCFDNSFSKLSEKMVFFEVGVSSRRDGSSWEELAEAEELLGYRMEDIRDRMEAVHLHLERTRQVQAVLRAYEARDRYLLEDNLWRVSFWSCMNLLLMVTVAATQTFTLRRLLQGGRRTCT